MRYSPQLIDATYALLLTASGDEALVIPSLNRDGDCLSDLVMQLFGSIAGAESLLLALDDDLKVETVMAEAPHGTAPSLQGKNIANPMAMILAGGALLTYLNDPRPSRRTRDLGIQPGSRLRRCPHRRPAGPCFDHRFHRRSHPPRQNQPRSLALAGRVTTPYICLTLPRRVGLPAG